MNKKLVAIRRIEDENRRRPIAEVLADINSGKHAKPSALSLTPQE